MKGKDVPEIFAHAINLIHGIVYTDLSKDYQWNMAQRIMPTHEEREKCNSLMQQLLNKILELKTELASQHQDVVGSDDKIAHIMEQFARCKYQEFKVTFLLWVKAYWRRFKKWAKIKRYQISCWWSRLWSEKPEIHHDGNEDLLP
mgnify:CR=1 FL=1